MRICETGGEEEEKIMFKKEHPCYGCNYEGPSCLECNKGTNKIEYELEEKRAYGLQRDGRKIFER